MLIFIIYNTKEGRLNNFQQGTTTAEQAGYLPSNWRPHSHGRSSAYSIFCFLSLCTFSLYSSVIASFISFYNITTNFSFMYQ